MKRIQINNVLLTLGLVLSANAMSQTILNAAGDSIEMTSEYHSVEMKGIKDQFMIDLEDCATMNGSAMKVCKTEAMAKQKIGLANLKSNYRPSVKNRHNASMVKANEAYSVAVAKCADMMGAEKSSCMKEATTVKMDDMMNAKADMKMPMSKSESNQTIAPNSTPMGMPESMPEKSMQQPNEEVTPVP